MYDDGERTLAWQLERLSMPPERALICPPDKYVDLPYLSGSVVMYYLNEVFTPLGWGYEILDWPDLQAQGRAGAFVCRLRVWFRFADGALAERHVIGQCAVRPAQGQALEDVGFNNLRMGSEGAITDGIKNAARTLGFRVGLGFYEDVMVAHFHLLDKPNNESKTDKPSESPKQQPSGNGQGQPSKAVGNGKTEPEVKNDWVMDRNKRAAVMATLKDKALTLEWVHEVLGVASLKDFPGTVTDFWRAVNKALEQAIEQAREGGK